MKYEGRAFDEALYSRTPSGGRYGIETHFTLKGGER